ncbi:ribosome biogenesis factor YjgA [Fastidiosibacter lacustris]|uniref:ribosome biogenesis factor YjgA n=1 Tax=Fastidiosibacter lacustris TaxID=2056695 RepID=UPI000E350E27|nr:ribosome biogenesis factor YjgA [Fastidiosibacter lacustris]
MIQEYYANGDHYDATNEQKSRTQIKKEAHSTTDFGKKLIELSEERIKKLPIDEKIIDEILKAKSMQRIALKRQIQYIGKLMRNTDLEKAYEIYEGFTQKNHAQSAKLHRLEQLRDELVNEHTTKDALNKLMSDYPNIDVQQLRQLIRNHHKEISQQKPLKSYRQIFQLLKETMQ